MKLEYGTSVSISPLIKSEVAIILFIPKCLSWESRCKKALVEVNGHQIVCNRGTKLLLGTEKGVIEKTLHFKKKNHYTINLLRYLKKKEIHYELGSGVYCDGTSFSQEAASGKILYNKRGFIEHVKGPYWGDQFLLTIISKKHRPSIQGKTVTSIVFNNCQLDRTSALIVWFESLLKKKMEISMYTLDSIIRSVHQQEGSEACRLIYQKGKSYDWIGYNIEP